MVTASEKQVEQFKASPPAILVWDGQQEWQKPRCEIRYFHRRRTEVWSGYVRTRDIRGWVENVRIALFLEKWKRDHGGALPTNEDILDWMVHDQHGEFDLRSLAESIVKNGVRQPIVITADATLLDGNRRYFSALMKLREAEKSGDRDTLSMVSQLPAYVLSPTCTKQDFDCVLIEENFVDDCRLKWPNFIKASKVHEAYQELREAGMTKTDALTEMADRFGLPRGRVDRFIKVMNFIDEFHDYHSTEDDESGRHARDEYDIKWREQKYFEYFDELSKTQVVNSLSVDAELRDKVFERLYDGDFINYVQIRELPKIAADRKARDKFMLGSGQQAVKEAIEWVTVTGYAKKAMDVNDRITSFKRFLESLTAQEIDNVDPVAARELEEIARKVASMVSAVHPKSKQ
jgi:hypothetical protein